jgi:hypothetical protein
MGSRNRLAAVTIAVVLAALASAPAATAAPPPGFKDFLPCPWENVETTDCVHWLFDDGAYEIGERTVPVVNPVTLQGGYTAEAPEDQFHGSEEGETLSKTPQPVPGGLLGVTAPMAWPMFLQEWWNEMIEEGFTGVNATIELAEPATAIELSYENLFLEEGTTLGLPVKIKLDNALLGANCYIGSNEPVELALSTGESGSLTGTPGTLSFNPELTIFTLTGIEVVDGTYALPGADGCGGIFSEFVDPLVDSIFGLPAGSENAATFEGVLRDASATAMRDP